MRSKYIGEEIIFSKPEVNIEQDDHFVTVKHNSDFFGAIQRIWIDGEEYRRCGGCDGLFTTNNLRSVPCRLTNLETWLCTNCEKIRELYDNIREGV